MVLYSFFKYIIYSHCIFSVFKCFVFFSRKYFFLYNLVVHSFGYKIYSRPCPFLREIFISAYFPLSSLASGDFGNKNLVSQDAKTMRIHQFYQLLVFGTPCIQVPCLLFQEIFLLYNFEIHSFEYKIYSRHCHLFQGNICLLVNHTLAKHNPSLLRNKREKSEFALAQNSNSKTKICDKTPK